MKRVQKNILGFSGLALVAGMTAAAALMPSQEASATTSSVTDTLVVKVVEDRPVVSFTSNEGASITAPSYTYNISYNYARTVTITLTYTDDQGNTHMATVRTIDADYNLGDFSETIDLSALTFTDGTAAGFGDYKLTATSIAIDGYLQEDYLTFSYLPVIGTITECGGVPCVHIESISSDVDRIVIKTESGVEVANVIVDLDEAPLGTLSLQADDVEIFDIPLDLDDVGCQETLYLYAYDIQPDGTERLLYSHSYRMGTTCPPVPNTGAPDTGGLFQNLNIAKEDYLITGLIVFFVLGIVGFGVVAKNRKATVTKKRR